MNSTFLKIGISSLASIAGNRLSHYKTSNVPNIKKVNTHDMLATTIGAISPMAIQYLTKNAIKSTDLTIAGTAGIGFCVSLGISYALHKRDYKKADKAIKNKEINIKDTKDFMPKIFNEIRDYLIKYNAWHKDNKHQSIYSKNLSFRDRLFKAYQIDNSNKKNILEIIEADFKSFEGLIEKSLYPFLGSNTDQINTSEEVARHQKEDIQTLFDSTKNACDSMRFYSDYPDWHVQCISEPQKSIEQFNHMTKSVTNALDQIKEIRNIIYAENYLLHKPIQKLAKFLASYIEGEYRDILMTKGIEPAIIFCSNSSFYSRSKEMKDLECSLRSLDLEDLYEFLEFSYKQMQWQTQLKKPSVDITPITKEIMSLTPHDETNILQKCQNIFLQAQKKKLSSLDDNISLIELNEQQQQQQQNKELLERLNKF